MSTWNRTGPVVVEVDGSAENLRIVDYAAAEALRCGADHLLSETLAPWTGKFPNVRVTRFLSSRQPAAALVRGGLVVPTY